MKRNQKNQITKDNNNSEDEEEEVGQMKLASASVLSTRVIKPLRKKTSFNTTNPFASLSTPIQPVTAPTPVKSTNDMYSNYASLNICLSNEIKYRLEKNPTTDLSHLLAEYYDKRAAIESVFVFNLEILSRAN